MKIIYYIHMAKTKRKNNQTIQKKINRNIKWEKVLRSRYRDLPHVSS